MDKRRIDEINRRLNERTYSQIDKLADALSNMDSKEWEELFWAVDDRVTYGQAKKILASAQSVFKNR